MKRLIVAIAFAARLMAQQAQPQGCPNDLQSAQLYNYTASDTEAPSGAAAVSTIQVPGSGLPSVTIRACAVSISSTVALSFTLERSGTIASTTILAPAPTNLEAPTAVTKAFKTSNVGAGTVLSQFQLAAGATIVLDLTKVYLVLGGDNITIRTSSVTGTVNINWQWFEQGRNGADPHP
jgi:hypothetical protein